MFMPIKTSTKMLYSKSIVKGYVIKKVENVKLGALQNAYHRRKLTLDLDIRQPTLTLESTDSQDDRGKRYIPLHQIDGVHLKDVKLVRENKHKEKQERKRSSSAVKRMFRKIAESAASKEADPYDYAFEIQMPDRQFLLYTELEVESKRWVRVLDLIVRMNKAGIPLHSANPFDYEKYLVDKNELSHIERY